ncbi:MAG: hypothetical protein WCE21_05300 [Candidatus Babeliales bacterium]
MKKMSMHALILVGICVTMVYALYPENFVIARKKGVARVSQDDIAQQAGQLVKDANALVGIVNRLQARAIALVDQYATTGSCTQKNESSMQLHKNIEELQIAVKHAITTLEPRLLAQ